MAVHTLDDLLKITICPREPGGGSGIYFEAESYDGAKLALPRFSMQKTIDLSAFTDK